MTVPFRSPGLTLDVASWTSATSRRPAHQESLVALLKTVVVAMWKREPASNALLVPLSRVAVVLEKLVRLNQTPEAYLAAARVWTTFGDRKRAQALRAEASPPATSVPRSK